jgi:tetratricopeptide (TPR) repeat protein
VPIIQQMTRKMAATLSACLIVKNEEANLPRCLAALRGRVDEMVVVDTGSSDRTVEIAKQHGAIVAHFAWCEDFAAARNVSFQHATGDWIVVIDADDELMEREPGALRRLCQQAPAGTAGFNMTVISPTDEAGETESVIYQWRVLRNRASIEYRGRVHEQLVSPDPNAHPLDQDEAWIRHAGYGHRGEAQASKSKRNLQLLEQAVAVAPGDPYNHYNLGCEYLAQSNPKAALASFELAIAFWQGAGKCDAGYVPALFATAASAAGQLSMYDRVLQIESVTPPAMVSAELLYNVGVACRRVGRNDDAIQRFTRAATDPSMVKRAGHERSTSTWRPLTMLAHIFAERGDHARASEYAKQALQAAPHRPEILFLAAQAALKLGLQIESLQLARELIAGERDDGYKRQARWLLLEMGNALDSDELIFEALSGDVGRTTEADRLLLLALAHSRFGRPDAQLQVLQEAAAKFPEDARVSLALARLSAEPALAGQ